MKKMLVILSGFLLLFLGTLSFPAAADSIFDPDAQIPYCQGDDCGLEVGVELVKTGVKDVETDGTFSEYIQEIVIYLLGFITLVAVIYIIYSGFRILTSSGDEETIKKAKNTIIYVVIGVVVIWLAWTIANFAISIGEAGE